MGYTMVVAAALFLYFRKSVPNRGIWSLGLALLLVGMIAPMSRGPWVGAVAMFAVFIATGPSPGKKLVSIGVLGLVTGAILLATPAGDAIIARLPFIGSVDDYNVTYRQRLLEISIQVILQNPFFGAPDFFYSPAMQELRQGSAGFIDLVNTYMGIGLTNGLIGLSLFAGYFIAIGAGILKGMRSLADRDDEAYLLGRVLFSTLVGIMVIIFTVSSITIIPVIYWSIAGLGVAYARMLALAKTPANKREAPKVHRFQPAAVTGR
jgi:O-antigen ligase